QDAEYFKTAFNAIQEFIKSGLVAAGHDVGSGGLVTTLLELCFADTDLTAQYDLTALDETDTVKALFNENIAVVSQATDDKALEKHFANAGVTVTKIGTVEQGEEVTFTNGADRFAFRVNELRDTWFKTSFLLDQKQTRNGLAQVRYNNYSEQPLSYQFPAHFTGRKPAFDPDKSRPKAAIIREKGSNSEREMANAMYLAGFDVKDVHMTDLIAGRET